jgi:hypothetical protein
MPSELEKMKSWTSQQVFDSLSNSELGTPTHVRATAEIQRRSMEIEQSSLEAQQKAVRAAADAAKSATLSARYALGSLVVAIVVGLAALFRK